MATQLAMSLGHSFLHLLPIAFFSSDILAAVHSEGPNSIATSPTYVVT